MPEFVFAYHGGAKPATPEEGQKAMAAWTAWFASLGAAVVDGGRPVGQSHTVSAKGIVHDGGANPLSGYSIVKANTLDAAIAMARGCPMVVDGTGSVEVAEAMEM